MNGPTLQKLVQEKSLGWVETLGVDKTCPGAEHSEARKKRGPRRDSRRLAFRGSCRKRTGIQKVGNSQMDEKQLCGNHGNTASRQEWVAMLRKDTAWMKVPNWPEGPLWSVWERKEQIVWQSIFHASSQ